MGGIVRIDSKLLVVILCAAVAGCPHDPPDLRLVGGDVGFDLGGAPAKVTLEAPTAPAAEGTTLTATVVLSRSNSQDVSVPFTVTLGTAGASDIIRMTTSPVSIAAGETRATVVFQVVDDPYQEEPPVETFTLTLGTPTNASLGATTTVALSITDADEDGLGPSISGRVTSVADGAGVADVAVSSLSAGGGVTAAVTDAQGFYRLANPDPAASIVITYSRDGYVPQIRLTEAMTTAPAAVVLNVPMVPVAVTESFDPALDHVTAAPGSVAQVGFLANSMQTSTGAAPTGNVTASLTPLAVSADLNVLPGNYRAGDGVAPAVPVESFGAVAMRLADAALNPMQMAAGQTATLRIPAASRGTPLPATVSLFYFDPVASLWREEGTATLAGTAPDEYYEGSIARFASFWSANAAYAVALATGCVVDPTGSRVAGATVVAEGTTYTGNATAVTDALGNFTVATRNGGNAYVQATYRTGISNAVDVPPLALDECLLVFPGAASIKLTWGQAPFDLDSHTLGPNQADHVRWDGLGSLTEAPFVALDVDDVTGFGPEVTTIVKAARNRTYRFMVQNYSHTYAPGMTDSPARVELFIKGRQTVFTPPAGETVDTPTWHVFDMVSDANCEITVVTPAVAPWRSETEGSLDEPALNPNLDNSATFCN